LAKKTLLLIEDEKAIRDMLRFSFSHHEFELIDAEDIASAMKVLSVQIPDLIILDWMLPDMSGIEFLKKIRKMENIKHIPVIMLTAKAEEENKIMGLVSGADDYITKPFSPHELAVRIRTVLRRGLIKSPDDKLMLDTICVDTNTKTVSIKDELLHLTANEYKLLYFFMTHADKVYTRDQLLDHVLGKSAMVSDRTIDVLIKRLRAKLKPHDCHRHIKTVRNTGYLFARQYENSSSC